MTLLLIVLLILALVVIGLVAFTARTAARVEAGLPPQGRFIDVPGARLHVVEKGEGPALLLIHGLASNLRHFTYGVMDRLAADYRVVAVDRPGCGYSVRLPGASATLGAQAEVMAALIDALQLGRPVVAGHSLGGGIALALAQRHPDKVAALALIAPLTHEPRQISPAFDGLKIGSPLMRRVIAWTLALPATMAKRDATLAMAFGPEAVPSDFATRGGGLLGVRPASFIGACTDLAAVGEDLPVMVASYATLQLPVSVLYGKGDRLLDPDEQAQPLVDKLPCTRLVLVEGGHMLPLTQVALTADFIRGVASGAAG